MDRNVFIDEKDNLMNENSSTHTLFLRTMLRHLLGEAVDVEELHKAKTHIASCSDCWEELMSLTSVLAPSGWTQFLNETAGAFPQGPTFVQERRLESSAASDVDEVSLWQRGRSYLARLSPENVVQQVIVFLNPDSWQSPLPAAHRSEKNAPSDMPSLEIDDLPGLSALVSILPVPDDTEHVIITVEVSIESRFPDFSGVHILLESPDEHDEQVTGISGRVEFRPVPRADISSMHLIILPLDGMD
jgi:hypothetical protein